MTETHELWGPAAEFSEHQVFDIIHYRAQLDWDPEPKIYRGEIVWVAAATDESPIRYIVAPDPPHGFVDIVYPSDIVIQSS